MGKEGKILIVDDNEDLLASFKLFLCSHFTGIHTIKNPGEILSLLKKENYDIILLDMNFKAGIISGNEGLYWLKRIREMDEDIAVVFITAYGDVDLAVKSMKEGATDFIEKSWDENKMLSSLLSAYHASKTRKKIRSLQAKQKHLSETINQSATIWHCRSPQMQTVYQTIKKVAPTGVNIMVTGESGTGKEVVARAIHDLSERHDEIFVPVDLGAIPDTLFESELFGYEKGAFTDAKVSKAGRFEVAQGGTLFLDEIANVPFYQQSKLLSVIQNKSITRLGAIKDIPIDVRLITATNGNLQEMVNTNSFREDLYYRINAISVEIPPLRSRPMDIEDLSRFFLQHYGKRYHKPSLHLSNEGISKLMSYHWPGNVRELQHVMEKVAILAEKEQVRAEDIFINTRNNHQAFFPSFNLEENEKEIIKNALGHFSGNISLTAKELGINRSTLYEKIRKYDL